MSMIKCPECGHEVSSLAKVCPQCGYPIEEHISEIVNSNKEEEKEETQEPTPKGIKDESTPMASEKKETSKGEPRNASRVSTILISILSLVAIIIATIFYLDIRRDNRREQQAYEILKDCNDPTVFEDFIARFPDNEHIDEVRQRYFELKKIQEEWGTKVLSGTRTELEEFIRDNAGSPYARMARARLDTLDWNDANTRGSLEAIEHYITSHPEGAFIAEAELKHTSLERARAEAELRAQAAKDSMAADTIATE